MTPRPVTVAPDANVRAALSALRRGRFRHLPVVAGEELVGVVTAADLEPPPASPVEAAEALGARQVAEVMSTGVVTVSPDEPVEAAAMRLAEHGVGCLPVLLDDRLVGILTKSDLLRVLLRVLGVLEPSSRITLVLPYDPANLFAARVGDRVPPERRAAFSERLERAASSSSSE